MLFNNQTQTGADAHQSMDGPQKHDTKWEMLHTKGYVLCDSSLVKCQEKKKKIYIYTGTE